MSRFSPKATSLVMVFVLLLVWHSPLRYQACASEAARQNKEEREKLVKQLEKLFDALEQAEREIPRDTFDPRAIVQKVGTDPEKLFEWVRDNTYWVPYRGSLRGPIGVLMDRLGNSLDRSLLLAELLSSTGHKVRLAHAELSEDQADKLLGAIRPVPNDPLPPEDSLSLSEIDGLVKENADRYGLDAGQLRETLGRMVVESQRMEEEIAQRVSEQAALLLAAVGKPRNTPDPRAAHRAAIRDHWWIQWGTQNVWCDLDPLLPDAKPGAALAEAERTIDPHEVSVDLCHLIDIRIIIEQYDDGKLKEHIVLEHTLRPSELFGVSIVFVHYPMNWPKDRNPLQNSKEAFPLFETAVLNENEWLPVLKIGQNVVFQRSFTDKGALNDEPNRQPAAKAGRRVGGIFGGALSAFRDDSTTEDRKADSFLTAEWIEYQIHVPGAPARTVRRQIFDLLGPAVRKDGSPHITKVSDEARKERGLALLDQTTILPLVCQFSPSFVANLLGKDLSANRELLIGLLSDGGVPVAQRLVGVANRITPLPGPEYALALVRGHSGVVRNCVYLDRPNVLTHRNGIRGLTQTALARYSGLDIVNNEVAIYPRATADSFRIRLHQGVLDTNMELLVKPRSAEGVENAANILASGSVLGLEWLTIRRPEDPVWGQVSIPNDTRTYVERDLTEGYVVLAPSRELVSGGRTIYGWWRVDPTTGQTLGMIADGSGGAGEYALNVLVGIFGIVECGLSAMSAEPGAQVGSAVFCLLAAGSTGGSLYFIWKGKRIYNLLCVYHSALFSLAGTFTASASGWER